MNTSTSGAGSSLPQPLEGEPQPGLGVDDAVLLRAAGEQVRVAQVRDRVPGRGVLTELDHASTVEGRLG